MVDGRLARDPAYGELKASALRLLLQRIPDDERGKIESFLEALEAETITAADADRVLQQIVAKSQALAPAARTQTIDLLQSAPFYFFFGFALLGLAFVASQTGLNTSLTFLVAMLGVAIMLYGTGSQAAASFGANPELAAQLLRDQRTATAGGPAATAAPAAANAAATDPAATAAATGTATTATGVGGGGEPTPPRISSPISPRAANLVIAGGAAVLTAFFGWGVITYQNQIRQVFRDYDQYTKVRVEFCDAAVSDCSDPNVLDNVALEATEPGRSVLSDTTLKQIRDGAYLETGLGERAYGKADDNGLEFIIFERDLGQSGTIKLLGAAAVQGNSMYSSDLNYFTFRDRGDTQASDRCLVRASKDSCLFIVTVRDGVDLDRVPRVVIRAVLSAQSLVVESDHPVVPQ